MKSLVIIVLASYLVSCISQQPILHKTYGEYSIGITEDSIVKLNQRLNKEKKRFSPNIEKDGIFMSYLVNKQKNGKSFFLYPATSVKGGIIIETLFYLSHDEYTTADVIKEVKENNITNYPLISKQECLDGGENFLGYEDVRNFIDSKLNENYGNQTTFHSTSYTDGFGVEVRELSEYWKNVDGIMDIDFVVRETDKVCFECQNIAPIEHTHKYYSRAEMFLTYYFNKQTVDKIGNKSKNDF